MGTQTESHEAAVPHVETADDPHQTCEEDSVCESETFAEVGHCYMMDTKLKMLGGHLVGASDLSIGAYVLDHKGIMRAVTWCRKLPKKKRLCVDLHTKPLTVTSSHRVVVPGGEVLEAKELKQNDEVLIGHERQQLLKVTKYYKYKEVMELEFEEDAIIEVHAPSILTKGSDPSLPIDQDGAIKVKLEDESSMTVDTMETGIDRRAEAAESTGQSQSWPDTDDDLR